VSNKSHSRKNGQRKVVPDTISSVVGKSGTGFKFVPYITMDRGDGVELFWQYDAMLAMFGIEVEHGVEFDAALLRRGCVKFGGRKDGRPTEIDITAFDETSTAVVAKPGDILIPDRVLRGLMAYVLTHRVIRDKKDLNLDCLILN
jgi:hypothetical protein